MKSPNSVIEELDKGVLNLSDLTNRELASLRKYVNKNTDDLQKYGNKVY